MRHMYKEEIEAHVVNSKSFCMKLILFRGICSCSVFVKCRFEMTLQAESVFLVCVVFWVFFF